MEDGLNLSVNFCGKIFLTPLISASGIVVHPHEIEKLMKVKGVGGVTTKSYSINPRVGHPLPHITSFKIGFLNAVGLKNPGIQKAKEEIKFLKKRSKKPIIVSIFGGQLADFAFLAKEVAKVKPDFIELNLSCPNVDDEFGKPFATDPLLSAMAVMEVKKINKKIPVIVKLTPNTPDLKKVAFEVEKAGADAICAINTVGPGLLIDIKKRRPVLGNKIGGVSGSAIRPIALRCVNEIFHTVKIPIVGMGGISSGEDAIAMIMAGASLVGIGSAIFEKGYQVFDTILEEIKIFMKKEGIKSLKQIRGII